MGAVNIDAAAKYSRLSVRDIFPVWKVWICHVALFSVLRTCHAICGVHSLRSADARRLDS